MPKAMTPELEAQATQFGGVWMPAPEKHFFEMMEPSRKNHKVIDGRWSYQYKKLKRAVDQLDENHRRVCIDIGAHVGLWSMHLVNVFDHVEAFEPVQLHADLFEINVLKDNYTLHRQALGAEPGIITIQTSDNKTGTAHVVLPGREDDRRTKDGKLLTYDDIEQRTLDSYGFEICDFIKIDVEGWEQKVIEGARETLMRCKPWLVVEQKGNDLSGYGFEQHGAANLLKRWGWTDVEVMAGDHIMRPPA
jgi:FkbM family methyltransferase